MSDSDMEIDRLRKELDYLKRERDERRQELEDLHAKSEESISAQLRLLSTELSKDIRQDFFVMLQRILWVVGSLLIIATAGGLWTVSGIIHDGVVAEVKERSEDVSELRKNIIQAAADFKFEARKALQEIADEKNKVETASTEARAFIAIRTTESVEITSMINETTAISESRAGIITIPLVVHDVHRLKTDKISEAQIISQVRVLNLAFRAKNSDISNVPEPFKPFVGDAQLEFVLAQRDPMGNATSGITRTKTTKTSFSTNDDIKSDLTGGVDPWDTNRYLNLWIGTLAGGVLGYAQFPGGPASTDGIVVSRQAFGTLGTAKAPFDKGRSLVGQVGRYLNLRNIWGDTVDCSGTDFVIDTPTQQGPSVGIPEFPSISCDNGPDGDMFMNYMNYVDDDVMLMFTKGQVARMRETLETTRNNLGRH